MYLTILLILASLLSGCSTAGLKYLPEKNPQPKYFLTVQGHIDPKLIKDVKITWILDFETSNQTDTHCEDVVSYFEGAIFPKDTYLKITTKPDKNGDFKQKLPLDYYSPGYCGWGLNNISVDAGDIKNIMVAFIGGNLKNLKNQAKANLVCQNKNCLEISAHGFNNENDLPIKNGFKFKLNIKPGETHDQH